MKRAHHAFLHDTMALFDDVVHVRGRAAHLLPNSFLQNGRIVQARAMIE